MRPWAIAARPEASRRWLATISDVEAGGEQRLERHHELAVARGNHDAVVCAVCSGPLGLGQQRQVGAIRRLACDGGTHRARRARFRARGCRCNRSRPRRGRQGGTRPPGGSARTPARSAARSVVRGSPSRLSMSTRWSVTFDTACARRTAALLHRGWTLCWRRCILCCAQMLIPVVLHTPDNICC